MLSQGRPAGAGRDLSGNTVSYSTAAVGTWASGLEVLQICRRTWLVRHTGLWNVVSSPAGENQYEMPGKKIQLNREIGPLECIRGRGEEKKRHKARSVHKNLLLTSF